MSDSKGINNLTYFMVCYVFFFERYGWKDYAFCILLACMYSFIDFELIYKDLKMRIKRIPRRNNE